ncbi:MAG: MarR family transcriptional regulator [Actinomycetota bacterium]|nr:MarR family transcriptional regulator [Actinomycetota bacterium]
MPVPSPDPGDPTAIAGRLRYSVFRLARLLRRQDDSGVAPALLTALAVIEREGEMTLGELARQEQVTPPTITKVVGALEERGFVERTRDEQDGRVTRVRTTAKGRRRLETSRARRTAWLATQLGDLSPDELARVADALDVLEHLTAAKTRVAP